MPTSLLDSIIPLIKDIVTSRYMLTAGLTIMIYDWMLTLSDEITYIWRARFSSVKAVFLINRYFMPLSLIFGVYAWSGQPDWLTIRVCTVWITTDSFLVLCFFASLHWIVAMRAWALWGRSRKMAVLIWGSFTSYFVSGAVLTGLAMSHMKIGPVPFANVCFGHLPSFLWTIWLPPIFFETLVFVLTAVKAIQHHNRKVETPILTILYRDGILYFVFICMNSFANLLVWAAAPTSKVILIKYFSTGICAAAGSHLILDLIEIGRLSGATTRSRTKTLSMGKPVGPKPAGLVGATHSKHEGEVFEMMTHGSFIQHPTLATFDRDNDEEEEATQTLSFSNWVAPTSWEYGGAGAGVGNGPNFNPTASGSSGLALLGRRSLSVGHHSEPHPYSYAATMGLARHNSASQVASAPAATSDEYTETEVLEQSRKRSQTRRPAGRTRINVPPEEQKVERPQNLRTRSYPQHQVNSTTYPPRSRSGSSSSGSGKKTNPDATPKMVERTPVPDETVTMPAPVQIRQSNFAGVGVHTRSVTWEDDTLAGLSAIPERERDRAQRTGGGGVEGSKPRRI